MVRYFRDRAAEAPIDISPHAVRRISQNVSDALMYLNALNRIHVIADHRFH